MFNLAAADFKQSVAPSLPRYAVLTPASGREETFQFRGGGNPAVLTRAVRRLCYAHSTSSRLYLLNPAEKTATSSSRLTTRPCGVRGGQGGAQVCGLNYVSLCSPVSLTK